jgi:hypothetical protein
VGQPPEAFPRSAVKSYQIERGPEWDRKPDLPDLSVTFIEVDPKNYSLHGRIQVDQFGRPLPTGAPVLKSQGIRDYMEPNKIIEGVHTNYRPGEELTFTAHVKNVGFAPAGPFRYTCLVDDEPILEGRFTDALNENQEVTFAAKWKWRTGQHTVRFRIEPEQPEIATINNETAAPLWGWGLIYIVNPGRVAAWRECRNAYGTFSWEDYYRWHIDLMNQLFADSVYPAAPEGIKARVRLDRIVYATDVPAAEQARWKENGLADDQGARVWHDSPEELASGKWAPPEHAARNQTEWTLLHDLGHELGLPDYQTLDYAGAEPHVAPDTGDKIGHLRAVPHTNDVPSRAVAIWRGRCRLFELSIDKPRGNRGDMFFALPRILAVRLTDMSGRGVPGAFVEFFQRGVVVEHEKQAGGIEDLKYWSVVEDGNFDHPVSAYPVMTGRSDPGGVVRLIPRPAESIRTLNGFQRRLNGFGNIDPEGKRGLMLVRVTKDDRQAHFWLDITEAITAWFRGEQEYYEFALQTPFGSLGAPPAPRDVKAERKGGHEVLKTWRRRQPNASNIPQPSLVIGCTAELATEVSTTRRGSGCRLASQGLSVTVDMRQFPVKFEHGSVVRLGVASAGECSNVSELVEVVLPVATAAAGE